MILKTPCPKGDKIAELWQFNSALDANNTFVDDYLRMRKNDLLIEGFFPDFSGNADH